jgi:hypothetical protein
MSFIDMLRHWVGSWTGLNEVVASASAGTIACLITACIAGMIVG